MKFADLFFSHEDLPLQAALFSSYRWTRFPRYSRSAQATSDRPELPTAKQTDVTRALLPVSWSHPRNQELCLYGHDVAGPDSLRTPSQAVGCEITLADKRYDGVTANEGSRELAL